MKISKFTARLQEMSAEEIMSIIPSDQYIRIKEEDENPMFRAYVVGHEGESEGKIVGIGTVVKTWFKSAIEKIRDKLQFGLPIFHRHDMTNEHEGRTPIGEVVGKTLRTIKDKLSVVAVAYIKQDFRHLPLDVASIEADVDLRESHGIHEADVQKITGIALGHSSTQKPGFEGATLLSQIQAFASQSQYNKRGGNMITINEVKDFIKAEGIKPSDLFGVDILSDDPSVKGLISSEVKSNVSGEYAHRKREAETFDKLKEEWGTKDKAKDEEILTLKKANLKFTVPEIYVEIKKERNFNEKEEKFMDKAVKKNFNPEDSDTIKADLNKFLDEQVDEFKEIAKDVFDVKDKDLKTDEKGDGDKTGKEDETSTEEVEEENPFIPTISKSS